MTEALADLATSDPNRTGAEKETGVSLLGDEDRATVFSAKRTVVRSLLLHEEFEPDWFIVADGDGTKHVESPEEAREAGAIYAVSGQMPVGCLLIKAKPRSNNNQSQIVNTDTTHD